MPYQLGRTASHEGALMASSARFLGPAREERTHVADVTVPTQLGDDAVQRCSWVLRRSEREEPCLHASPVESARDCCIFQVGDSAVLSLGSSQSI